MKFDGSESLNALFIQERTLWNDRVNSSNCSFSTSEELGWLEQFPNSFDFFGASSINFRTPARVFTSASSFAAMAAALAMQEDGSCKRECDNF